MNQILNDEIRDDPMRSKIPSSKNFLKANDILSKATTSYNFYKHKNKKDIMEKITDILNDKGNKENFDSCYLIGNPNDNAKNTNYKYNSASNTNNIFNHNNNIYNNNNFPKTVIASGNKFLKPKQDLNFNNVNNYNQNNNMNVNNKKYAFEDDFNTKREIPRYLKNEGIKVFSPKADYNNKFNSNFFDNLNIYRDTNLNRMNMPYATSQFLDKNENKIFTDKVKNDINSNDKNKYLKNNFKAFYEQFNNSKSKHNKNSTLRESIENKPDSYPEQNKNEEQDRNLKYFKCKDPESTNLFLTKFNMKSKQKDNFEINSGQINKNLNDSNSLNLNKKLQNENNLKDKPHISPNKGVLNDEENMLENCNKEIEQNVSKSIDIEKEADSSYHSLKNEFSFLLEKKCESEIFNLRDIINDVKIAQNKLSSEYDDIKNLLKYANDTKSKLQMHKTDNRFFNIKNKLNSNNNNNFNHKSYTGHINNMIINNTNGYLKNSSNMNNKNFNSNKKERERDKEAIEEKKNNLNKQETIKLREKIDYKIKLNKADNLPNSNSLSADEYLLLGENSKISKKEKSKDLELYKKLNKKRALSYMNCDDILPNTDKNLITHAKNLTSKNQNRKNFINLVNKEENQTNNYYMIKSQMLNKKEENLNNEDLIFDPADIEMPKRLVNHGNRNKPNSNNNNIIYDGNFKTSNNNFNSINHEEFKHDINNKNIFDREIKTIYNVGNNKKYFAPDKINIQKFNKNFALQSKLNFGISKSHNNNYFKLSKEEENKPENNYVTNNFENVDPKYIKQDSKRNLKNFNELKKHEYKKKIVFDSLEDEKLNSEENINLNAFYKNNYVTNTIKKKFSGSLNNFHKNKNFNLDSLEEMKKDYNPSNNIKNKYSYPQQHIVKDLSANPYLKFNKNFVDKKNFLEIIKKNSNLSHNKNTNKFSFEKKNMSKTNYNFAEFMKSNGNAEKKTASDFYKKKNLMIKEKLIIAAETNFVSNNILNDGFKGMNNKNKNN